VKIQVALILGAWALAGLVFSVARVLFPSSLSAAPFQASAAALIVLGAASLSFWLKRRVQKRTRSAAPDSAETRLATKAQAASMVDGLIVGSLLGLLLLLQPGIPAALMVFALVAIVVADFQVRYAIALRQEKRAQ
jgi:hypothetical protein